MHRKIVWKVISTVVLALALAAAMTGQDYKPMLGKWSMTSDTNGGDSITWSLVLKEVDGKLAAFLAIEAGEQPAKDATFADGVLKFKAPYEGEDYDITLKLVGDKLDGTWSGNGDSGKTSGVRQQALNTLARYIGPA